MTIKSDKTYKTVWIQRRLIMKDDGVDEKDGKVIHSDAEYNATIKLKYPMTRKEIHKRFGHLNHTQWIG